MPITIKELFPSDPLSEALEKINFNFDQLILAGGGPPGPAGPIGPQGVPGPLGKRGDHWFVGASALGQTADHDGGSLKVEDHFLDSLGDVYSNSDLYIFVLNSYNNVLGFIFRKSQRCQFLNRR
jgi:hypothetical protein